MITDETLTRSDRSITISDYARAEKNFFIHYSGSSMSACHYHRFIELMYVLDGTAEHTLNGNVSVIEKNDFLFLDFGDVHGFKSIGETPLRIVNILFDPSFFSVSLSECRSFAQTLNYCLDLSMKSIARQNISGSIIRDSEGTVRQLISRLSDEYDSGLFGSTTVLKSIMSEIFVQAVRLTPHAAFEEASTIVRQMIEYTDKHIEEKISLDDISRQLMYCVPYLSRRFKKEMRITYTEYLHRQKIMRSCYLLLNTDMKISEISDRMGYCDAKHFSNIFKKYTGFTPHAFLVSDSSERHSNQE